MLDGETSKSSAEIHVPYSRIQDDLDGHTDTNIVHWVFLSIGRTVKKYLDKEDQAFYSALTMSTVDMRTSSATTPILSSSSSPSDAGEAESVVFGKLFLEITQDALSLQTLEDINPIDIEGFFGTIGGIWEIMMLAWGLIFVSSATAPQHLKIRDFTAPLKRAQGILLSRGGEQKAEDEVRPAWDTTATRMENGTLMNTRRPSVTSLNLRTADWNLPMADELPWPTDGSQRWKGARRHHSHGYITR